MATITRWLFKNGQNSDTFVVDGNAWNLPNVKNVGDEPCVLHDGILYYGKPLVIAEHSDAPCSKNCREASEPYCRCSCMGKNHGIDNRDMANAIQEEDVIYLGWE